MRLVEHLRQAPSGNSGLRPVKSPLTPREWEVVDLLAESRTTDEIATTLVLATETVRSHVKNIMRKLEARSRQEAVEAAERMRSNPGRVAPVFGRLRGHGPGGPVRTPVSRQREEEAVRMRGRARDPDHAAVALHDPAHDREPEPGAARAALGQPALPRLEDALAVGLRDRRARAAGRRRSTPTSE